MESQSDSSSSSKPPISQASGKKVNRLEGRSRFLRSLGFDDKNRPDPGVTAMDAARQKAIENTTDRNAEKEPNSGASHYPPSVAEAMSLLASMDFSSFGSRLGEQSSGENGGQQLIGESPLTGSTGAFFLLDDLPPATVLDADETEADEEGSDPDGLALKAELGPGFPGTGSVLEKSADSPGDSRGGKDSAEEVEANDLEETEGEEESNRPNLETAPTSCELSSMEPQGEAETPEPVQEEGDAAAAESTEASPERSGAESDRYSPEARLDVPSVDDEVWNQVEQRSQAEAETSETESVTSPAAESGAELERDAIADELTVREQEPIEPTPAVLDVACPDCQKILSLRSEHLGIEGQCVWCETPIVAAASGLDGRVRVFRVAPIEREADPEAVEPETGPPAADSVEDLVETDRSADVEMKEAPERDSQVPAPAEASHSFSPPAGEAMIPERTELPGDTRGAESARESQPAAAEDGAFVWPEGDKGSPPDFLAEDVLANAEKELIPEERSEPSGAGLASTPDMPVPGEPPDVGSQSANGESEMTEETPEPFQRLNAGAPLPVTPPAEIAEVEESLGQELPEAAAGVDLEKSADPTWPEIFPAQAPNPDPETSIREDEKGIAPADQELPVSEWPWPDVPEPTDENSDLVAGEPVETNPQVPETPDLTDSTTSESDFPSAALSDAPAGTDSGPKTLPEKPSGDSTPESITAESLWGLPPKPEKEPSPKAESKAGGNSFPRRKLLDSSFATPDESAPALAGKPNFSEPLSNQAKNPAAAPGQTPDPEKLAYRSVRTQKGNEKPRRSPGKTAGIFVAVVALICGAGAASFFLPDLLKQFSGSIERQAEMETPSATMMPAFENSTKEADASVGDQKSNPNPESGIQKPIVPLKERKG